MKSLIAILFFTFLNCALATEKYKTPFGILEVVIKNDKSSNLKTYGIFYKNKPIILPDENVKKILIASPEKHPEVFLLQTITNDSGCPAKYTIIRLYEGEPEPVIKEMYANCSIKTKDQYSNYDEFEVRIGNELWGYRNGRVMQYGE